MARKPKETLSNATPRKAKDATENGDGMSMTVKDKIKIVAMSINHMGKKAIAGATGFPMDWVQLIIDVHGANPEFVRAAVALNKGKSIDDVQITEGTGSLKRG